MSTITDPDNLHQNIEVKISTQTKTISLNIAGNLSIDGVTGQCLYSFLKEQWKSDNNLIKFPFPMLSITNEQFEFINGWLPENDSTRKLIRTAGWAEYGSTGVSITRKYAGIITLGSLGASDQVYFSQATSGTYSSAVNFTYLGPVNEAIQIFGDSSNGAFDVSSYLKLFVRIQGKSYAQSQISDIGVTAMSYIVYRFPLTNAADSKITHTDATISATTPWTGIYITYLSASENVTIGTSAYPYNIIIYGNNASKEQIYEKVQYLLRQSIDIDTGSGSTIGRIADTLLNFSGETLVTTKGVYVSAFNSSDTNNIQFTDTTSVPRTYPYVASLTLNFNDVLQNDAAGIYRVFFTNDNAGSNLGRDFATSGAIIVQNASSVAMSGTIGGNASISFTYDYDGNIQRGAGSAGTDAPITVVAQGLSNAQYVKATGTIARSTANSISLVSSLERNYSNP